MDNKVLVKGKAYTIENCEADVVYFGNRNGLDLFVELIGANADIPRESPSIAISSSQIIVDGYSVTVTNFHGSKRGFHEFKSPEDQELYKKGHESRLARIFEDRTRMSEEAEH